MRWISLAVTLAAMGWAVLARSAGALGLALLIALLGLLVTAFAFAHARIHASARDEQLNAFELEQLRRQMRSGQSDSRGGDDGARGV